MRTSIRRALGGAILCATAALSLSACSGSTVVKPETQAESIAQQKADLNTFIRYIPAANRGAITVTGQNGGNKEGQYLQCDDVSQQFLTGRLVRTTGFDAQKFIQETIKQKFEAAGYSTSYYTAQKPNKLIADKNGFEIWVSSGAVGGEKDKAGEAQQSVIFTSFGQCYPIQTASSTPSASAR